ncbi:MAG: SoxR reducing system RseC family protein [Christensenellales bacterium]
MKRNRNCGAAGKKRALVVFERSSACQHCGACQRADGAQMQVWLPNEKNAQVGDKVRVELGAKSMLRATWLAYIFPLVMLFAGVGLGYWLAPENSRSSLRPLPPSSGRAWRMSFCG